MFEKKIVYHVNDLPDNFFARGDVAIDTETMGLSTCRDRLCVVQLYFSQEENVVHVVHFKSNCEKGNNARIQAPNLTRILETDNLLKVYHFARFDLAILQYTFHVHIKNVYCTKVASRIARTYTQSHGLKDLCLDLLHIKISKQQQTSYWGAEDLTKEQLEYATNDVIFLHQLRAVLDGMLRREGRLDIAQGCFDFLPIRARMDILGWNDSVLAYKCVTD